MEGLLEMGSRILGMDAAVVYSEVGDVIESVNVIRYGV
jgi:hypothetical protein